jgi:branched-chain amino acid transport system substrate-binding protein
MDHRSIQTRRQSEESTSDRDTGVTGRGGAGGGQGGGEASTVKLVSDLPLQGSSRIETVSMVAAIKMALEERNYKAGDIEIEYESMDDATAQAGQDEEVVGWIGPFNSGCAAVEIPILNEAQLGMISPTNTYIGLTKPSPDPSEPEKYYPTGDRNYARVIVADNKQGAATAKLMNQQGIGLHPRRQGDLRQGARG